MNYKISEHHNKAGTTSFFVEWGDGDWNYHGPFKTLEAARAHIQDLLMEQTTGFIGYHDAFEPDSNCKYISSDEVQPAPTYHILTGHGYLSDDEVRLSAQAASERVNLAESKTSSYRDGFEDGAFFARKHYQDNGPEYCEAHICDDGNWKLGPAHDREDSWADKADYEKMDQ